MLFERPPQRATSFAWSSVVRHDVRFHKRGEKYSTDSERCGRNVETTLPSKEAFPRMTSSCSRYRVNDLRSEPRAPRIPFPSVRSRRLALEKVRDEDDVLT